MALGRFLITRPRVQAESFAADLAARGVEAVIAPLSEVVFLPGPELTADYDLLIVTSANGVAGLARRLSARTIPLVAVGPQTAAAAKAAGFELVINTDGNADVLAAQIPALVGPGARILHVAGRNGKGLTLPGFVLTRLEVYGIAPLAHMPQAGADALRNGTLSGVFFFSPGSAVIFRDCVLADGLAAFCAPLTACCISQAASCRLPPLAFARMRIAPHPNRTAMLDLVL